MEEAKKIVRRRHDEALKLRILDECAKPGASVAAVALAHGLNANLVHKWRRHAQRDATGSDAGTQGFLAVAVTPVSAPAVPDIRIELRRGAVAITVTWPASAAAECGLWMREVLR